MISNNNIKSLPYFGVSLLFILWFTLVSVGAVWGAEVQKIGADQVRDLSKQFLLDELTWDQERLAIKIEYRGGDLILPKGPLDWNFKLPGRKNRIGRVPFQLTLQQDGRIIRQIRLQATIQVTYNLFKTTKQLQRGHIFDLNDVKSIQVHSKILLRNKINDWAQLEGRQLTRNIEEGEILSNYMVKKVPLVKRGDRILLIAKRGTLKVTAPGVVRENGFKDQMVKVENVQSHKIVYGTVLNSKTILVNF